MKTLQQLVTLILTLWTFALLAQQGINYKALIKDNNGNIVANQNITVQFQILEGAGMVNVYQETHNPTTDVNGIVMVNIGEGTPVSGNYATIDWGADEHHLNVQINTGNGLTDMGTTQFMAVPYALHSNAVASNSLKIDDLVDGKSDNDGTEDGSSLFLGKNAGLNDDASDNRNVGIGMEVFFNNTTGQFNTANGYHAFYSNTTGSYNVALGSDALYSNIIGSSNTAIGDHALNLNTEGYSNAATGNFTLYNNTTGHSNTAMGTSSLINNTTGDENTVIGLGAGYLNEMGDGNVFLGYKSGYFETGSNTLYIDNTDAGVNNALIYGEFGTDNTTAGNILRTNGEFQIGNPTGTGYAFPVSGGTTNQVLQADGYGNLNWISGNSLGVQNINDLSDGKSDNDGTNNGSSIFLGFNAGVNDDGTDNKNTGIGFEALHSNTTGFNNTALGYQALSSNTTGTVNTAIGYRVLQFNTSGHNNTATGYGALNINSTGYQNTATGNTTLLFNTTGYNNTATGYRALYYNTQGYNNTASGFEALYYNDTGNFNTVAGYQALYTNNADENTVFGYQAMYNNTIGYANTAVGFGALLANTLGFRNSALGYRALSDVTTGDNNTAIGYNAQVPNATSNNQVRIGNSSVGYAGIQVAWDVTSDRRWKENIRELPYGLEFVKQLKPVDYVRKNNNAKTREIGFIGQEVEALLAEIGYDDQGLLHKDDKGYISLRYNDFIAILTKGMQEQQEIIDHQQKEIESLKSNQSNLNQRLKTLEASINQ